MSHSNLHTGSLSAQLFEPVYVYAVPGLGSFEIRPFDLEEDIALIHAWVNQAYAQYWGMMGMSLEEVKAAYSATLTHSKVYIGMFQGQAAFLLERYDPLQDLIGQYYEVSNGDQGMHLLVAPREKRIPGFTSYIFSAIMCFMFANDKVQRIVVEPDIRNDKIHILNKRAGFEYECILELPHKIARLAFCTRAQHEAAQNDINNTTNIR